MSLVHLVLATLDKMQAKLRQHGLVLVRMDSFAAYLGMIKNDEDMRIASRAILRHGTSSQKGPKSLAMLLKSVYVYGQGLKASDPRDFIFGPLNMSTDPASLGIFADYSKSKQQLFVEVATAFIKQTGLELLSWSNYQELSKTETPLPS